MKICYRNTGEIGAASQFNIYATSEVLTGDNTVYIRDLDVWIEALQTWKSLADAFRDRDVIVDNYNTYFFEPTNEEDRKRGYTL